MSISQNWPVQPGKHSQRKSPFKSTHDPLPQATESQADMLGEGEGVTRTVVELMTATSVVVMVKEFDREGSVGATGEGERELKLVVGKGELEKTLVDVREEILLDSEGEEMVVV